jgi:large subunit ribosomal protein L24
MKIVKGDIVYIRKGKDAAGVSRLREALHVKSAEELQAQVEKLPMAEQQALANKVEGARGKVIEVLVGKDKVVVEGLNLVTKHQKPRQGSAAAQLQQGGRIEIPAAIPVSRVMLVCPSCNAPTRVAMKLVEVSRNTLAGQKTVTRRERVCKQCEQIIPRPTEKID